MTAPMIARGKKAQPDGTYRCSGCGECKPPEDFQRHARNAVQSRCRSCCEAQRRARGVKLRVQPLDHPPGLKRCRNCLEARPLDAFSPDPRGVLGRQTLCNPCKQAKYAADPDRVTANGRTYYENKKDERLRRLYGMTLEQFRDLMAFQGGRCACCGDEIEGRTRSGRLVAHVDHDWRTGAVRGLCCFECNVGLAKFKEDRRRFMGALDYLSSPPATRLFGESIPVAPEKYRQRADRKSSRRAGAS